MAGTAPEIETITTNEVRIVSVDFSGLLDDGELLTGTPTVTAPVGSGLVLSQKQVTASAITVNDVTLAAGQAVQFKVDATAATAASRYGIEILCGTDAGQTLEGNITLRVVDS